MRESTTYLSGNEQILCSIKILQYIWVALWAPIDPVWAKGHAKIMLLVAGPHPAECCCKQNIVVVTEVNLVNASRRTRRED